MSPQDPSQSPEETPQSAEDTPGRPQEPSQSAQEPSRSAEVYDVLAFGAHPDDLELSAGGLLALLAQRGRRVGLIDLTAGEAATNGTPEERAREAQEAAAQLGAQMRRCLGLRDGGLSAHDPAALDALVREIRQWRPQVVLAPWPADRHPDHRATGELVERAYFLAGLVRHAPELGPPHRPRRVLFYIGRYEQQPSFVTDVSAVYEHKQRAIACHRSQFGAAIGEAQAGERPTLINQPLGLGAFEARDRYWGATVGVRYGEPYRVRGGVLLADPFAAFAEAPAPVLFGPE